MKGPLTPQSKKSLSYAKDGRNTIAEARSIARKAIKKRKAKANRALRRAEKIATVNAARSGEADAYVARDGRGSWRKVPDAPLAEYVSARLSVRHSTGMNEVRRENAVSEKGRKSAKIRPKVLKGSLQKRDAPATE
jgi:hypothetical protein